MLLGAVNRCEPVEGEKNGAVRVQFLNRCVNKTKKFLNICLPVAKSAHNLYYTSAWEIQQGLRRRVTDSCHFTYITIGILFPDPGSFLSFKKPDINIFVKKSNSDLLHCCCFRKFFFNETTYLVWRFGNIFIILINKKTSYHQESDMDDIKYKRIRIHISVLRGQT